MVVDAPRWGRRLLSDKQIYAHLEVNLLRSKEKLEAIVHKALDMGIITKNKRNFLTREH